MAPPVRRWGWHRLDPSWARRLVADAALAPHSLVVDCGAGDGVLTDALVRAGMRVIAVELHPARVAQLRDRFQRYGDRVVVVQADVGSLRLPLRPYHVVANPPFGATSALVRRIVQRGSRLASAHIVLQEQAARRWCSPTAPGAQRWQHTFEAALGRPVPRAAFRPAPAVPCRVLVLQRA
ncbi:MAG TPA: rRNA adenine N-6-methyltransferase family protein [Acidimicrobiia bacterium]